MKQLSSPWIAPFLLLVALPALADETSVQELEDRLEVLAEELRRVKEQMALPDTDEELESWGGLGPAASKVYGVGSGLSIGGYGEYSFQTATGAKQSATTADMLRLVTYVGYKFTDRLVMNSELEFEHATTSANHAGSAGSVSVEFAYLDFLVRDGFNVRAGTLLLPMGFLNEMHEPPFYRGNVRPVTETQIIPSTWRELGAGFHGGLSDALAYKLYVVNGLDAKRFGSSGVRGGRQKGNRVLFEDAGIVAAVTFEPSPRLLVGGSVYGGGSGHDRTFDGEKRRVTHRIAEGRVKVRHRGFEGRFLIAASSIDDAGAVSRDLSDGETTVVVPEQQLGWYVEGAYDVGPALGLPEPMALSPWIRYEAVDLHRRVPDGFAADPAKDQEVVTVGLEWKPVPQVVIKAEALFEEAAGDGSTVDPFRVGAGFVF